jgi:hypothetical protein
MMPPPISKANGLKCREPWKKARKSCLRSKLRQKAYRFNAIAITALQNYSLYLYKTRNDILHDGDEETSAIVHVQLNEEIRQLYRDKEDFSPDDKAYFRTPIERILQRPPRGRRRWLYLVHLIASRATDRVTEGQQVMPSYLLPTTTIRAQHLRLRNLLPTHRSKGTSTRQTSRTSTIVLVLLLTLS